MLFWTQFELNFDYSYMGAVKNLRFENQLLPHEELKRVEFGSLVK